MPVRLHQSVELAATLADASDLIELGPQPQFNATVSSVARIKRSYVAALFGGGGRCAY